MEIRRRDFLKIVGGVSGGALLGSYGIDPMYAVPKEVIDRATFGPRVETWTNTVCSLCPAGCGMKVRLINGVPVTLKGNPLSPVSRGGMCPLGLNALHSLYHPDRIQGPLERKGTPGSDSWEGTTWDTALTTIVSKLEQLRADGNPHRVAILGADEQGFLKRHVERFAAAYGTPNYFRFSAGLLKDAGYILSQGDERTPSADLLNARLVVSFGANFLEEGPTPIYYTKLFSRHEEQNTRYIHVDARMNRTASNADMWIPIRPGTYSALAMGIAYVLIREELYDAAFVARNTYGFDDWTDRRGKRHTGFRSLVLSEYYPEKVQELTGVPSATILELGRELGNTRPSLLLCDQGAIEHTNGAFTVMAVNAVNALLGSYEQKGGLFFVDEPPFTRFGRVSTDATARSGLARPSVGRATDGAFPLSSFTTESFMQNVLSDEPYPVEVLFVIGGNPLFQTSHKKAMTQALEKIPLIVSFDVMPTETNEFAHFILPGHHFMEQWDLVSDVPTVGFSQVGVQKPVIDPMYDTRHIGDVLIDLAARIGGRVEKAYPYGTYEEGIRIAMRGVYESNTGAIAAEGTGRQWIEFLNQRGWHIDSHSSFDDFWERLVRYGGWWNPIRSQKSLRSIFRTPSGKFEFYSRKLVEIVNNIASKRGKGGSEEDALKVMGISAGGDTAYLPHYEPLADHQKLPLQLISFRTMPIGDGRGASLPMMQELFGHSVNSHWDSWAELHPDTARHYGIENDQWLLVQTDQGTLRLRSRITKGIVPEVIAIPFGLGHTSGGRYAKGHGVNPTLVMEGIHDRLSGREAHHATKVKISAG